MGRPDSTQQILLAYALAVAVSILVGLWACYLNYACRQTCALEGFNTGKSFGPSQCECWQESTKAHVPRR